MKHYLNKCARWLVVVSCLTALTTQAKTGVWTNVSGGYWADSNNWENAYVPLGAGNCADFRALGSGGTITITNHTGIGAILFAGVETDVWELVAEDDATMSWDNRLQANAPPTIGEIYVEGGILNLQPVFYWAGSGIAKTGSGGLRFANTYTYTGITRLDRGTLLLATDAALLYSAVLFSATNAVLTLEADAQIGGVASQVHHTPDIDLNGHTLSVGGSGLNYEWGGQLTGNGNFTMVRGGFQTLTATQSLTSVQLDSGCLQLGKSVGRTVAWYRFESPGTLYQDSGTLGNNLTAAGAPTWANDPVRGGVLALNGASYLTGAGPNNGLSGLPAGNSPFTVAFWLKPDAAVNNAAGLFKWGPANQNYKINGMRLNTSSSFMPLLHTNWGNNRAIPSSVSLVNGAWHHLSIVYTGLRYRFYIDGMLSLDEAQGQELSVIADDFRLGCAWSTTYFKGLIDDFVIADWAMNAEELYVVRNEGQEPDVSGYVLNNLLPASVNLEVGCNGILRLLGDQTFATLGGEGADGGVSLQDGGTLTAAGIGSTTSTVFRSAISDDGRFVKRGVDYTLMLGGVNTYTGATEVQEGTLALDPGGRGLQAYYRFDDAASLGKDSSGNGYDLGASNTPSFEMSGKIGGAVGFSSLNKELLKADSFPARVPTKNSSYTFAVWCNPSSANTKGMPLFWGQYYTSPKPNSGCGNLFRFDGITDILVSNLGNNQTVEAGFDLFDDMLNNGWHHIASTYDGATRMRKVYIDGVLKYMDLNTFDLDMQNQIFQLGGAPYSDDNFYDGLLDELQIYNSALTHSEVLEVMLGGTVTTSTMNILPVTTSVQVSEGARFNVNGAMQRVAVLQGAGEVDVGGGSLTVAGGTGEFAGILTGDGEVAVRDSAVQTLSGAGTFGGTLIVSNATLLVANTSGSATGEGCSVTVQDGGYLGGAGAITGNVVFEDGAGIAAGSGTETLTVNGTVTLGASGTVALEQPEEYCGGRYTLIAATSISAPSGLSGWDVTPAPAKMVTLLRVSGGTLTLSVLRPATLLMIQ